MPATPPPDIDLEIWENSFTAILERKPARLLSHALRILRNPAEHVLAVSERCTNGQRSREQHAIRFGRIRRMASFMAASAEIAEHLPAEEVEHYVFSAGLHRLFWDWRVIAKRAQVAS